MAALYTIGNFTIDDIVLHDGRIWIDQAGGNVLYSALGARVWLDDVGIIARQGNDLPEHYLSALSVLGIDLALAPVALPNLHNWALYEPDGSRQFILHCSSGRYDDMCIRASEIPPDRQGADAYHIASMPTTYQHALARALKRPATLVSLDPHYEYIERHVAQLIDTLRYIDLFLPSRVEARLLYGDDQPERAAREFARHGPRVVAVKLGADGSLVYDAAHDRLTHVPICPVEVADTTGAGDAYCGGFLASYRARRDPVEAACRGTVSASYVVQSIGALHVRHPPPAEAEERLAAVRERITHLEIKEANHYGHEQYGPQVAEHAGRHRRPGAVRARRDAREL